MSAADPTPDPSPAAVRVAASTSNLGPGFDCLGLALELFVDARLVGPSPDGAHRLVDAEGEARAWPEDGGLLARAFDAVFDAAGRERVACAFAARSDVPLERGLGSSGAAVAAGALLANHLCGDALSLHALARIGLELEGHPDNSTASLFGGCTIGVPDGDALHVVRADLADELRFAVAWSDATLATERARAALPRDVPFADAVENPRRLALLLDGLRRGDRARVAAGGRDALHVGHRLPLIPGGAEALRAAEDAGAWLATISGAGSALVAIASADEVDAVAAAMADALHDHASGARQRSVRASIAAPHVEAPHRPR